MKTLNHRQAYGATEAKLESAKAAQAREERGIAHRIEGAEAALDDVLDDGVKINITPLQEAELLRLRRVV